MEPLLGMAFPCLSWFPLYRIMMIGAICDRGLLLAIRTGHSHAPFSHLGLVLANVRRADAAQRRLRAEQGPFRLTTDAVPS